MKRVHVRFLPNCCSRAPGSRQPEDDPGSILEEDPDSLLGGHALVHRVSVREVVDLGDGVLLAAAAGALASELLTDVGLMREKAMT